MRIGIAIAFCVLAPFAWIAGSSAMLCLVTMQWPSFVFPYDQWVQAIPWINRVSVLLRIALIGSVVPPTLVVILLALTLFNLMRNRRKRPLIHGETGWADAAEMRTGKLRLDKEIF